MTVCGEINIAGLGPIDDVDHGSWPGGEAIQHLKYEERVGAALSVQSQHPIQGSW